MKKILISFFFLLQGLLTVAQNKINYYEYWFDNDYAGRVSSTITPVVDYQLNTVASTAALPTGLHVLNVRFRDDSMHFSQVMSSFFYKVPQTSLTAQNNIEEYEYWFDNDYANKVQNTITAQKDFNLITSATTASLQNGLHVLNVRFKDAVGLWSQVYSQFFEKNGTSQTVNNAITEYEYWYDNDYANKVSTSIVAQKDFNLSTTANAASLPVGLHVVNIRFKDTVGSWSQVYTQFFEKNGATQTVNNLITKYEYWFDNDYTNHVTQSISPTANFQLNTAVNMSSLGDGLHVVNVRFQDTAGLWSQAVSQFVYKVHNPPVTNPHLIVAYRYWVDNDFANAINVQLASPTKDLNLNTVVNLISTPKGARYFNIQFRDTTGLWSVVQTDSFFKTPVPWANFSSTAGNLCDSGTVSFINNSVDADLYHWDFGDGDTSILSSPTHTYTSTGTYTVSLLVKDTLLNIQDDTVRVGYITVDTLPTVNATASNDTLCAGQSTVLTGTGSAATFTWSGGVVNNQSFVPTNSQMYVVTGTNGNCSVQDSIFIQVDPKPTVSINPVVPQDSVCNGTSVTLAAVGASTYSWTGPQSITNNVPFTANTSGTYTIVGTNIFGCKDTASKYLHVYPLPTVSIGSVLPNDSVCNNTSVTISASGAATYQWSGPQSIANATPFIANTSGTYAVTGTDANGCTNTTSILLTVFNLPNVTVGNVIPNDTVCLGTSTTLIGNGATNYVWSGPQNILNNTPFSATLSGMYTVTGTDANGCSNTATINLLVNPLPNVFVSNVAPNDTVCNGTSLTLSGGGATSYQWSGPQTISDNVPFAANNSGVYLVSGVDANGCSNIDSVYIHVKPIPTFSLGSDTSICQGDSLLLFQPYQNASVLWSTSASSDSIYVYTLGIYSCNVTVDGCSFSDTIEVTVDSLPVADFTYSINNSNLIITDNSKFGKSLKYYFGDGDSSSLQSPTHNYVANGNYTIKQIVTNDCGSDTLEQTIRIITGVENYEVKRDILVYPNPTNGMLNIDLLDYEGSDVHLNLLDLKGSIIFKEFIRNANDIITMDLSSVASGIYILDIKMGQQHYVNRVNINR